MRRRLVSLLASAFIISSQLGCGILSDAFSCDDEEKELNESQLAYDRAWDAKIAGTITEAQFQDALNRRVKAGIEYDDCKGN